jgi:hypothetical protein
MQPHSIGVYEASGLLRLPPPVSPPGLPMRNDLLQESPVGRATKEKMHVLPSAAPALELHHTIRYE